MEEQYFYQNVWYAIAQHFLKAQFIQKLGIKTPLSKIHLLSDILFQEVLTINTKTFLINCNDNLLTAKVILYQLLTIKAV